MSGALPVLMYHGIHDDRRTPGIFDPIYSVTVDAFARQLDALLAGGFTTVRLGAATGAPRPVVLTFDDGDRSNAEIALPMLRERGMVAEFFVPSDRVDRAGSMTVDDLRAVAAAGMGIGSHGRTHAHLAELSESALREELVTSRAVLAARAGAPVEALSLPGGRGGRREARVARALGYRHLLNSTPGPNRRPRPAGYLHRIAVTRGMPLERYLALVRWRGAEPWRVVGRVAALEVPKRVLGNARYATYRERMIDR